jgi:glycyl-tRNA synthetase beta subunit
MTNLLVELQTEELPPKALDTLSKAFGNEIAKSLAAQHLTEAGSVATCAASRFTSRTCLTTPPTNLSPKS